MNRRTKLVCALSGALLAAGLLAAAAPAWANGPAAPGADVPADTPSQAETEPGLLIVRIDKAGAAYKAGLRRGDVILEIGSKPVNALSELQSELAARKPGDRVDITVQRGDGTLTYSVQLGERDGNAYLGVTPYLEGPSAAPAPALPTPTAPRAMPTPRAPSTTTPRAIVVTGARVGEVVAGGAAEKAGLQAGDVITVVNDRKLGADDTLASVIGALKPGDKVSLTIERAGKSLELEAVLGENPDTPGRAYLGVSYTMQSTRAETPVQPPAPQATPAAPGGQTPALPPQIEDWLKNLPLPGRDRAIEGAVVIREVVKGSPADKAGLQVNDVIVEVAGKKMNTPQDVVSAVQSARIGDTLKLTVRRQGESGTRAIEAVLGENPDVPGRAYLGVSMSLRAASPSGGWQILPGLTLPFDPGDLFEQQPAEPNPNSVM